MGKKGKVGKERKDRYYKLAKEQGFRSRAAFKLIQLNRKFEFLETARVCIDLCAAPGGWLQVCRQFMPVSSVILGIDLVPIRPIHNVITLQCDITTPECDTLIENNLSTWKADLVLHDGAPNVGRSWLHDAYTQNVLVLHSLKLACKHLNRGGWFITKVFRSNDYDSLFWVLSKLFKRVHRTKPTASRSVSAEAFFVCENFLKPAEIDPRFFDPVHVFADISDYDEHLKKQKADLLKPASKVKKAKARGYESLNVFESVSARDFVLSDDHMRMLAQCHEIRFDNEDIDNHPATTQEIRECCKDIKVLGRKDLLSLIDWRRKVRKELYIQLKALEEAEYAHLVDCGSEGDIDETKRIDGFSCTEDDEMAGETEMELEDVEDKEEEEEKKELKKLKRKEEKRRKDYEQRIKYGMINKGDTLIEEENDLFGLMNISNKRHLDDLQDGSLEDVVHEDVDPKADILDKEGINHFTNKKGKRVTFSRDEFSQNIPSECGNYESDSDEDVETASDNEPKQHDAVKIKPAKTILKKDSKTVMEILASLEGEDGGGLLQDLEAGGNKKASRAKKFFDRETFTQLDLDHEVELDAIDKIAALNAKSVSQTRFSGDKVTDHNNSEFESGDECVSNYNDDDRSTDENQDRSDCDSEADNENEEERHLKLKRKKLDPEGLALATMMIKSAKSRRDIEDEAWNRYTHADSHLAPKWFRDEEKKYYRRNLPVSQELAKEYRDKIREINQKPIKKVVEAKARQKKRALRKMEKVRKKVESITSNEELSQKETITAIRNVYKNATKTKKKLPTLVVGRKGLPPNKPKAGKYKMVDSRMKKDARGRGSKQNPKGGAKKAKRRGSNRDRQQTRPSQPQQQKQSGGSRRGGFSTGSKFKGRSSSKPHRKDSKAGSRGGRGRKSRSKQ